MTREEAKKWFKEDVDSYGKPKAIMSKIDKIYDDFDFILTDITKRLDEIHNDFKINIENRIDKIYNKINNSDDAKSKGYS